MEIRQAIRAIENPNFPTQFSLVSGIQLLLKLFSEDEAVKTLTQELAANDRVGELILRRIVVLSRKNFDLNYENPWDTALAAYIHILDKAKHPAAREADTIIGTIPNCFWAFQTNQGKQIAVIYLRNDQTIQMHPDEVEEWMKANADQVEPRVLPVRGKRRVGQQLNRQEEFLAAVAEIDRLFQGRCAMMGDEAAFAQALDELKKKFAPVISKLAQRSIEIK